MSPPPLHRALMAPREIVPIPQNPLYPRSHTRRKGYVLIIPYLVLGDAVEVPLGVNDLKALTPPLSRGSRLAFSGVRITK